MGAGVGVCGGGGGRFPFEDASKDLNHMHQQINPSEVLMRHDFKMMTTIGRCVPEIASNRLFSQCDARPPANVIDFTVPKTVRPAMTQPFRQRIRPGKFDFAVSQATTSDGNMQSIDPQFRLIGLVGPAGAWMERSLVPSRGQVEQ